MPVPGRRFPGAAARSRSRKLDQLAIDAIDWIPRHRVPSERTRYTGDLDSVGSENLLRGDLRVQMMTEAEYILGRDKYGSQAQFWNWGNLYPDE